MGFFLRKKQTQATDSSPSLTSELTQYFVSVQERANLVDFAFSKENHLQVPLQEVRSGKLPEETAKKLFELERKNSSNKKPNPNEPISLVISLITLEEHRKHQGLLLLPATLGPDGTISVELESNSPWIPASRMTSPGTPDKEVMVGPLRNYWKFLHQQSETLIGNIESTTDAVSYAYQLFGSVQDQNFQALTQSQNQPAGERQSGYQDQNSATPNRASDEHQNRPRIIFDTCFIAPGTIVVANRGILNLLSDLKKNSDQAPLYRRLVNLNPPSKTGVENLYGQSQMQGLLSTAIAAKGSMSNGFPLTPSQRKSLHAFLKSENGEITAVSGPPGTGKTTLLQSVVASLIVQHALDGKNAPLIVGTSTNNQAVTNIIESFKKVTPDNPSIWEQRWLPEIPTSQTPARYNPLSPNRAETDTQLQPDSLASEPEAIGGLAAYCPSGMKTKEAQKAGYLVENPYKSGVYQPYSDEYYREQAWNYFQQQAAKAQIVTAGTRMSEVSELIRQHLTHLENCRQQLLTDFVPLDERSNPNQVFRFLVPQLESREEAAQEVYLKTINDQKLLGYLGNDLLKICNADTLDELDQTLDITLRYRQFWLAVHYYEAKWLEHIFSEDRIAESDLGKNTKKIMDTYWGAITSLTPCFVMTAYQLPRYFALWSPDEGNNPNYGAIDLLIVDEAGQVDTTLGAAGFALAKRALVVGDVRQLAPVWSVDPESDEELGDAHGLGQYWDELKAAGLTGSQPSSLMAAASHACQWEYGKTKPDGTRQGGLFLSEHFRCHSEIINYCNDLIYDGMLEPKRPESSWPLGQIVDIPFLFRPVPGSKDETQGSSRRNLVEAEAIVEWIVKHHELFTEIYPGRKASPIGVVTPFKAQANLIKRVLNQHPQKPRAAITIGTAHTLQGAERPVILFSSVYGENSNATSFIENTHELMNVAVSRAKDLFIVFGAEKRRSDTGKVFSLIRQHAQVNECDFVTAKEVQDEPLGSVQLAEDEVAFENKEIPQGDSQNVGDEKTETATEECSESPADSEFAAAVETSAIENQVETLSPLERELMVPTLGQNGMHRISAETYFQVQDEYYPKAAYISGSMLLKIATELGVELPNVPRAGKKESRYSARDLNETLATNGLIKNIDGNWIPTLQGRERGIVVKLANNSKPDRHSATTEESTSQPSTFSSYCVYPISMLTTIVEIVRNLQ
ncbi:hypothetical protein BK816_08495 [Boudabousia tangfeifanii]|uniref:DNA2/NAM7 helicase-like C-terminal domain-containing protein n=1 Tax=Boudabousia tangfeifanii TaxID=1912795 RepID=A0A1D9MLQ2_9ACTO|nr:AAA domain-containing protein [Boudabousia tangfeifanii]AOZ73311.1 hypothetical protein BK816_08495 [Boudabousia tangfeifanii]